MFRNWKVRTLLTASLSLLAVAIGVVGIGGIMGIGATNSSLVESSDDVPTVVAVLGAREHIEHARLILDRLAATSSAEERLADLPLVYENVHASDRDWAAYLAYPATDGERQLAAKVNETRSRYMTDGIERAVSALQASNIDDARRIVFNVMPPLSVAFGKATEQLKDFQVKDSLELARRGERHERSLIVLNVTLTIFGVALAFASWRALRGKISAPLADALRHFSSIEHGDLTGRVAVDHNDEFGVLMRSLGAMQRSLKSTVAVIRDGVVRIADSATDIAAGSSDLSRRTEEQAASLEQTASSLEQLTATVQQNADHVREASALSREVSQSAASNAASVRQLAEDLKDLRNGSDKIAEITSIIEEIAFQTNILALNASVEAARAGIQGRGFAVVASEVRALAERSGVAAKEIKGLIGSSIQRVSDGATHAIDAAERVDNMAKATNRVTKLLEEISTASGEQSRGLEQIVTAVSQMDGVTQQNAALVEQAAAASESLNVQAIAIRNAVSRFRVAEEQ